MLIIFVIPKENKFGIACFFHYHNDGSVSKQGRIPNVLVMPVRRIKVHYFN